MANQNEGNAGGGKSEVVEGKFGTSPIEIPETVQKVPQQTKEQYQTMAVKSNSLKIAGDEVLNVNDKDGLKAALPSAIVVKKNLNKDVHELYDSYKQYKQSNENEEEVKQFKDACNNVIREAQKVHKEIKNKINTIYEK